MPNRLMPNRHDTFSPLRQKRTSMKQRIASKMLNGIWITGIVLTFSHCSMSQYYRVRSHFLPPVNYTGGLCQISTPVKDKLITQDILGDNRDLALKISQIMKKQTLYFAISVLDQVSGYSFSINRENIFHAASTFKTAILLAVMRMDQDHEVSIHDTIVIQNQFESIVDGSLYSLEDDSSDPDITFTQVGQSVTIKELLDIMIEKSSNLATNNLIKFISLDKINRKINSMGSGVKIVRGISDDKAYGECINNLISAHDLEHLYEIILDKRSLDDRHKQMIIEILKKSSEHDRLAGKLPPSAEIAHKPGNTSKVLHDSGIIIPESGDPYLITILASEYKSSARTAKAMGDVSLLVYEEIVKARSGRMPQIPGNKKR